MARRLPVLLLLTLLGATGCTTVAPSAVPDDDRPPHAPATGPLPAESARGHDASSSGRSDSGADTGRKDGERRADDRRSDEPRRGKGHDRAEDRDRERGHDDLREKTGDDDGTPERGPEHEPPADVPDADRPAVPAPAPAAPPESRPEHHQRPPVVRPGEQERARPQRPHRRPAGGGAGLSGLCDQADKVTDPSVAGLCHKAYG